MATEELDINDLDPDSLVRDKVLAGVYHVAVSKINEEGGKNHDALEIDFEVQTVGKMQGRTHRDFTDKGHAEWARKKRLQLAICLGLVSKEQIDEAKKNRKPLSFDWQHGVGRHLGVIVTEEEYEGKKQYKSQWADSIRQLTDAEIVPHVNRKAVQAATDEQDGDPFGDSKPASPAAEKSAPAEEDNPFA